MRVLVRHGHFAFFPKTPEEVGQFVRFLGTDLVRDEDFYTFTALKGAPRFSLAVKPYLNLPAIKTYEGRGPWEVMRENNFVYNVTLGLLVPKLSIVLKIDLPGSGYYYRAPAQLIQPGSRNGSGQQILSYDAEFEQDFSRLKVLEFQYE